MNPRVTMDTDGKRVDLPVITGTEGERGLDVSRLREQTGMITYDPGYVNTGSCTSSITFLDGDRGILRYRGIPIEELANRSNFLETAFLLIYGQLPKEDELRSFVEDDPNFLAFLSPFHNPPV